MRQRFILIGREANIRLTVTFDSFEDWCKRARETANKLDRGERIKPSRGINLKTPHIPETDLLELLEAERPGLSARDIDLVITLTRTKRDIDAHALPDLQSDTCYKQAS